MRHAGRGAVLVMTLAVLAGCITTTPDIEDETASTTAQWPALVPPVPEYDFSRVVDPDHAHHLPGLHTEGHGLTLVGHAGIQDILPLGVRGSITQIDIFEDWAVVSGMEGGLAFAIVDISDRSAPTTVSSFPSSADGWTARFSKDGAYVFYGCQRLEGTNPYAVIGGACDDPEGILSGPDNPSGVIAVDVTDKTSPKFVDFLPTTGSHNLVAAMIDGIDYIFTNAVDIVRFDRDTGRLEHLGNVPGTHDASVAQHPVTEDWLLFTGRGQLTIYDVNDPADPLTVFEGESGDGWTGWHEQTLVPGLVDGRVILVLAGETFASTSPPGEGTRLHDTISIADVTDPTNPKLLGTWQPPFDPLLPWVSYLYSAHEIAATPTGQVAIAWYHAGVWVIDVSTQERQEAPVTLAAYQPNKEMNVLPSTFAQTPLPYVPFVWGAGWSADGHLIVPDMHTGLYVLGPSWGLHEGVDGGQ